MCDNCKEIKSCLEVGFVVKDELWKEVCEKQGWRRFGGIICRRCFEEALGRELSIKDLPKTGDPIYQKKNGKAQKCSGEIPINFWIIERDLERGIDISERLIEIDNSISYWKNKSTMDLENEIVCERAIKTRMDFKNKIEKKIRGED